MNARDNIHERIHGPGYCDPPCGLCREVTGLVDDLLDEYARELAEKVRGHLLPDDEQPHVPWNRAVRNLAELIDPEVSE